MAVRMYVYRIYSSRLANFVNYTLYIACMGNVNVGSSCKQSGASNTCNVFEHLKKLHDIGSVR